MTLLTHCSAACGELMAGLAVLVGGGQRRKRASPTAVCCTQASQWERCSGCLSGRLRTLHAVSPFPLHWPVYITCLASLTAHWSWLMCCQGGPPVQLAPPSLPVQQVRSGIALQALRLHLLLLLLLTAVCGLAAPLAVWQHVACAAPHSCQVKPAFLCGCRLAGGVAVAAGCSRWRHGAASAAE